MSSARTLPGIVFFDHNAPRNSQFGANGFDARLALEVAPIVLRHVHITGDDFYIDEFEPCPRPTCAGTAPRVRRARRIPPGSGAAAFDFVVVPPLAHDALRRRSSFLPRSSRKRRKLERGCVGPVGRGRSQDTGWRAFAYLLTDRVFFHSDTTRHLVLAARHEGRAFFGWELLRCHIIGFAVYQITIESDGLHC